MFPLFKNQSETVCRQGLAFGDTDVVVGMWNVRQGACGSFLTITTAAYFVMRNRKRSWAR